jgi:hypothetical protein
LTIDDVSWIKGLITTKSCMREYMANQQTQGIVNPVAAWASAFGNTFTVVTFIAIFGIIISLFLRRPKKPAEGGHMLIG